jgi:hypothetical protein
MENKDESRLSINLDKLLSFVNNNSEVAIKKVTDYQYRLSCNSIILDIFPMSRKYHNVTLNKRGKYSDEKDLLTFLKIK